MKEVIAYLNEWAQHYAKNKDVILRQIVEISPKEEEILVKHKNKEEHYLILPDLNELKKTLNDRKHTDAITIVTVNNHGNLKKAVQEWNHLLNFKQLKIIFVNPFAKDDKKWLVSPFVHNSICDKSSIEKGLKSIAEPVEEITLEEFKKKAGKEK